MSGFGSSRQGTGLLRLARNAPARFLTLKIRVSIIAVFASHLIGIEADCDGIESKRAIIRDDISHHGKATLFASQVSVLSTLGDPAEVPGSSKFAPVVFANALRFEGINVSETDLKRRFDLREVFSVEKIF